MAVFWAMMEAARTSETLVNSYQTTRRYNSEEDSHLHTRRRENLKSYVIVLDYLKMKLHLNERNSLNVACRSKYDIK
jgi:hypothetical protein